jgi:predicted ribosome quality control (RQC) complex YloA/Tae2 family protein
MKKQLAGLELHYLIKELNNYEGCKVDQIYQNEKEFTFQMHKTNIGKFLIKIMLPGMMFISKYKGEQPEKPPGFCTFLRKRLKNARLQKIKQLDFERIVNFTFSTKESEVNLIIELFGDGNIIFTDNNLKIISLFQTQNWKDRTLRGGINYTFPKRDINLLNKKDIIKKIKESNKESIVKTLALDLGLGGTYSEEICFISNIDKNKKELNDKEINILFESIQNIFNKEIKGTVTENDIHPFELKTKKTIQIYTSYSEALDEILTEHKINTENKTNVSKKEKENNKVTNMINEQEKRIKELEIEIKENQIKSELIYLNYNIIKQLLEEAKIKIKTDNGKKELLNNTIVKNIDKKIITIDIK